MNNKPIIIGGAAFEHQIMNGAGYCKDWDHVKKLAPSLCSAVVLGSVTKDPREGNPGDVYYGKVDEKFAINSLGMPNKGMSYFDKELPSMAELCKKHEKPLIVSIAGFTPSEYAELTARAWRAGVTFIELNLGCPNVWNDNKQKPIASFEPTLIREILDRVEESIQTLFPVLVKLSPYSDPSLLERVAEVLASRDNLAGIVVSNTFPNAMAFNEKGRPLIDNALGGLSGPPMLKIGQGQVKQFRKLLPETTAVIGVGGINSGQDVLDYIRAGATAVQITTALVNEGPYVFDRILREFTEVIETNGGMK